MRRLAYGLLACAVLVAAGVLLLSASVSDESVRHAAIERIETLTGYNVEIRGSTVVAVFPLPRFEIRDIVLTRPGAKPAGVQKADAKDAGSRKRGELASVDILRGSVKLLPLLLGRFDVGDFTLQRPRLKLVVDRRGRANWTPARRGGANTGTSPGDNAKSGEPVEDRMIPADTSIGGFRVENGAITYIDRRNGSQDKITAINAAIAWPSLASPVDSVGSFIWNGENVQFGFDASTPLDFLRHGTSSTRFYGNSGVANMTFDGEARHTADPQLEGNVTLTSPSTRALLRWVGTDLGAGAGLNALELSAALNFLPKSLSLSELALTLDGNTAEGGVQVTIDDSGTQLQGTLAFDMLDLGQYRVQVIDDPDAPSKPPATMATVVDLSPLEMVAADLRLSATSVLYGSLQLEHSAGTITVRNGTLDIGVGEASIYGGTAQGTVTANPTPEGARIKAALILNDTEIGSLLQALSGGAPLEGVTDATINLIGNGHTVAEILADLSGDARLEISDGAIIGINVGNLLDALKAGQIKGWPTSAGESKTEFSELTAAFVVTNGNAATDDFHMSGPNIDVSAEGDVRFVPPSVAGRGVADLRADSEETDNGDANLLAVPFVIEGPIARPLIYPDPLWLLNRSMAEPDDVDRLREELEQEKPDDVVDGLLERSLDRAPDVKSREAPTAPKQ